MKHLPLIIAFLAVSAGWLSAAERVALVVGNDAYQHARKLNAAVNDAKAVGRALEKLDFKVITLTDAGVEDMLDAVNRLKREAKNAESVLVYYAGHGIESGGVNYLVPVDAKLEREVQLKIQTVSLDGILEELKEINVPARMVILDCCRDNPLEGRSWLQTRSSGSGLAALAQDTIGEATLVVFSASPGKPALDRVNDDDAHSPFTSALLEQLPKPGVHSFEMFGRVEDGVIKRTRGRQAPRIFYNGSTQPFRHFRFTTGVVPVVAENAPDISAPAPISPVIPPAPVPADKLKISSFWNHNGSTMGLIVRGIERTMIYVEVSDELSGLVKPNTVLFSGYTRDGKYFGKVWRFSNTLPPSEYDVTGEILENGAHIYLTGKAPIRNPNGTVDRIVDDKLEFFYLRREK